MVIRVKKILELSDHSARAYWRDRLLTSGLRFWFTW